MIADLDEPINLYLIERWLRQLIKAGRPVDAIRVLHRFGMTLKAARQVVDRMAEELQDD